MEVDYSHSNCQQTLFTLHANTFFYGEIFCHVIRVPPCVLPQICLNEASEVAYETNEYQSLFFFYTINNYSYHIYLFEYVLDRVVSIRR